MGAGCAPARRQLPHADDGRARRDAPRPAWGVSARCPSGRRKSRGGAFDRQHPPRPARRGRRPAARRSGTRGSSSGAETAPLRRVPGVPRCRARPPAQRSVQGSGSNARPGSSARRRGRDERVAGAARLPGTRAHQSRHRRVVGRPSRRRPAAPRGRPQPHAPDPTAVPRAGLPRASRDRGAADRAAAAARARAERAGTGDCRGARLEQPVDDDRRVCDGRHGARADGALRRSRAPSRSGGGDAPAGSRPRDRGRASPCPRHAALRRGPVRRSPGGLRARARLAAIARQRARVHRRRARPGSPGSGSDGRYRGCAARALRFEHGSAQPCRDPRRARGTGARRGQPGPGRRGAGAGDRRFCAGAVRAVGARRGAAARRHGA